MRALAWLSPSPTTEGPRPLAQRRGASMSPVNEVEPDFRSINTQYEGRKPVKETCKNFLWPQVKIAQARAQANLRASTANTHLSMKYFFLKLLPPRLDFMQTMTDAEKAIMHAHGSYWAGFAEKGWAVAYGPVMGEHGGFGAGFWALPDDVDPEPLTRDDPAMRANAGFRYEISPMPVLVVGKMRQASTS